MRNVGQDVAIFSAFLQNELVMYSCINKQLKSFQYASTFYLSFARDKVKWPFLILNDSVETQHRFNTNTLHASYRLG